MADIIQVPWLVRWAAEILWTLPSPTAAWADIIGSLSWPLLVAFLVVRFRRYLRSFLETLADRLVTDHVKLGPFELTPNSQVLVLDPDEADPEFSGDDLTRIEKLFEFIGGSNGEARMRQWVTDNLGTDTKLVDFLTEAAYAKARENAVQQLIGDQK